MARVFSKDGKQIGVADKMGNLFYFDKKDIKNPPAAKDIVIKEAGK